MSVWSKVVLYHVLAITSLWTDEVTAWFHRTRLQVLSTVMSDDGPSPPRSARNRGGLQHDNRVCENRG